MSGKKAADGTRDGPTEAASLKSLCENNKSEVGKTIQSLPLKVQENLFHEKQNKTPKQTAK